MPGRGPKLGRRKTALLIVVAVMLLMLAWYQGGERPLRPIKEAVAVPEGIL